MSRKEEQELEQLRGERLALYAENEELKLQLEHCKWQMDEIEKQQQEIRTLHENVRKLKHDMRNHLLVIASHLNHGEYAKAREYSSDVMDRLDAVCSYVESGNALLDHILNEKLSLARAKGIDVSAQIDRVLFESMKGIDFSAVLNNLLDNAIEAGEKEEKKEIRIKIFRKKGYDAISVKNRIGQSVLERNPKLESSKTEHSESGAHGFGVKQIKETVERYQGMYDFYEADGFFCANVFIPQSM